ncbi:MAG: hypothetical protein H6550_07315 [Chitinophagales bacterium]|nr:hypothetical protein [Chitinophagales bacterium]
MKQLLYISFLLVLCPAVAKAQKFTPVDSLRSTPADMDTSTAIKQDAITVRSDTVIKVAADTVKKKKVFEPNAKKAGMYSAILPGLGQAYNRQYWKVPLVYAILGGAGYFIGYNYTKYRDYRQAYIYSIDGDPGTYNDLTQFYDATQLQRLQNNYKKDLDIIVLLTSVGYALQIMDAVASAHLKNFDISRDISMKVKPVLQQNYVGMGLVMNFK